MCGAHNCAVRSLGRCYKLNRCVRVCVASVRGRCYNFLKGDVFPLDIEPSLRLVPCTKRGIAQWCHVSIFWNNYTNDHKVIDDAVKWLSQLAKDSDAHVRVEAVDSLRTFVCRQSFDALCQATVDSDALVRGYAAYGVAIIGKEISFDEAKIILLSMVACENNPRVLVDIYEGLYVLGETTALKDLFSLIHIDDYLVQCAVIHACEEIANDRNRQIILSFLSRDIPFDNTVVKSACQNAIENIAEQEQ